MKWKRKKKGNADIYIHPAIPQAIVDRKGYGINSSMGNTITFIGKPFKNIPDAKSYAERKYRKEIGNVMDLRMQKRDYVEQQEELD